MESSPKIPVFVFPHELKFYSSSKSTHKQLLTIHNPYDAPVKYQILSTAPHKYVVVGPEGSIGPQMCVDIVVRHVMPTEANLNITDKFRVTLQNHVTKQIIGKRVIESTLLVGDQEITNDGGFMTLHSISRSTATDVALDSGSPSSESPNVLAVLTAVVCTVMVFLPIQGEKSAWSDLIPEYLHVTHDLKYLLCYILGVVTVSLFFKTRAV